MRLKRFTEGQTNLRKPHTTALRKTKEWNVPKTTASKTPLEKARDICNMSAEGCLDCRYKVIFLIEIILKKCDDFKVKNEIKPDKS